MLIAGHRVTGIGLGAAQFAFDGPSGTPPQAALEVARRRGVSVHRVLLAWLRDQSPDLLPLVGASRPASIRDSAVLLDLTDRDRADLS
jgi:aryl-alcohol dehydrogenase-like predicted oxidoreductase